MINNTDTIYLFIWKLLSRFFEMYLFEDRFAFRRLSPPIRAIESTRKIKNRRVSRNECISAACALFTATRCRAGSELWRKDCSITTATSEVYTRVYVYACLCATSLRSGLEEGSCESAESYREITAYARSRGCISIYLARASGFNVHVQTPTPNTTDGVLGALFCRLFCSLCILSLSLILSPPC